MQVESSFYRFLLFPFIDRDSLQVRLRCCHFSKRFQWEPGELKMKTKKSSLLSEVGLTVLKKTPSDHGIILLCVCVCVCVFSSVGVVGFVGRRRRRRRQRRRRFLRPLAAAGHRRPRDGTPPGTFRQGSGGFFTSYFLSFLLFFIGSHLVARRALVEPRALR